MSDDMPPAGATQTVPGPRRDEPEERDELRNDSEDMPLAIVIDGVGMVVLMPGERYDPIRVRR